MSNQNIANIGYIEISPEGYILTAGHCDFAAAEHVSALMGGEIVFISVDRIDLMNMATWVYDRENDEFDVRPSLAAPASEIVANGSSEIFFDFPEGTTGTINGAEFAISDGSGLIFTTDTPGEYLVNAMLPFPFLPFRHVVVAHAP